MLEYSYDANGNVAMRKVENITLPQIAGQPVQQIAAPGDFATFTVVVADARAVTFQWKFNGTDIPGATGDSLLLTNVSAANEGQYSVVVTNSAGSVTSAPAALLLDSNGDGLPDSWVKANFTNPDPASPFNPASQRSAGDPDNDGVSNLDEFFDGTNPTSNTSLRPRLTAFSDAGGSVTVAPMKRSYDLGETVTLMATPLAPSGFAGWIGDLTGTSNPATLTMERNKLVRARFVSAVPIPPGLVALWRGETDASDLVGGHDGTFFSGTTATVPHITTSGKVGSAFNFDGTVHVRVPGSAALKTAQFTLEAWIFPTMLYENLQTVIACGISTIYPETWWMGVYDGKPRFWTRVAVLVEAPSAIPLNEWTHVAASFDGMNMRLYVNGVQVYFQGGLGALVYDAAVPVTIGADWINNAPTNRFNGRIDEVAIYNRALTLGEVKDIYNADVAGKDVTRPYFTSPSQLPDGVSGTGYTQQLTTILGRTPVNFTLAAGSLPPGMTLSSVGDVSGVPGAPGLFDFTVQATDAVGMFTEHLCLLRVLS
jgi:hypothetical protein